MAFRQLTEKELELLTDSQRESYEQKLEIHRERVRFVEQLEKMEEMELPSFQPTLNPIAPISGAPEKKFVKTEHQIGTLPETRTRIVKVRARASVSIEQAVVSPQIPTRGRVRTVRMDEQPAAAPVLPEYRPVQLPLREYKAEKPVRAKVPANVSVKAPGVTFSSTESVKTQVSVAAAVQVPGVGFLSPEPVRARVSATAAHVPGVTFSSSEPVKAQVPDVEKLKSPDCPKVALDMAALKLHHINAPKVVCPKNREIQKEIPKMTALTESIEIRPAETSYIAPVFSTVMPGTVSAAVFPEKKYQKPRVGSPEIPVSVKVRVQKNTYHVPQICKAEPVIPTPQIGTSAWTFVQPTVPDAQIAHPAAIHTPKINYPQKGFDVRKPPLAQAVRIPDPQTNEILHHLLKKANVK